MTDCLQDDIGPFVGIFNVEGFRDLSIGLSLKEKVVKLSGFLYQSKMVITDIFKPVDHFKKHNHSRDLFGLEFNC